MRCLFYLQALAAEPGGVLDPLPGLDRHGVLEAQLSDRGLRVGNAQEPVVPLHPQPPQPPKRGRDLDALALSLRDAGGQTHCKKSLGVT